MQVPPSALRIIELLGNAGYEAYLVGGCVRDFLLGTRSHDIDITSAALPAEVHAVLQEAGLPVYDTGVAYGTVTAICDGDPIEITTFRTDGAYVDGRHPEGVAFTRSLTDDLARRDFTVNAMAYSVDDYIIDPFGGKADLKAGIIRCVGDPDVRFSEDALRILRALRFASQLGFTIDPATQKAVRTHAPDLLRIAPERVGNEFTKLLCGRQAMEVLLAYVDVIGLFIPELLPEVGFDQHNKAHCYDVWTHTAHVVQNIAPEPLLRYTALFHDVGKPQTFKPDDKGVGHFPGHPEVGGRMARQILSRLRLPNAMVERVGVLIDNHEIGLLPEVTNMRRWISKLGTTTVREILALKRADVGALDPAYAAHITIFDSIEDVLDGIEERGDCCTLKALAVHGDDLLGAGFSKGPELGVTLAWLLDQVIDDRVQNDRDALLALAKTRLG